MVEVFGTGVNIESVLTGVGQSIYTTANNIASTMVATASKVGDYVYNGLMWFGQWLASVLRSIWEWFKSFFTQYLQLTTSNPLYFTLSTVNILMLINAMWNWGGSRYRAIPVAESEQVERLPKA